MFRDRIGYLATFGEFWKEQTLLNIVRVRYGDAPTFRCRRFSAPTRCRGRSTPIGPTPSPPALRPGCHGHLSRLPDDVLHAARLRISRACKHKFTVELHMHMLNTDRSPAMADTITAFLMSLRRKE